MSYVSTIAARRARRDRRRLALPLLAGALAIGAVGCGDLLDVRDPDIVTPADLSGAPGLATLRAGAFGDLAVALSGSAAGHGGTPGFILMSAVVSDEMLYSGTFPTRREPDQRNVLLRNGTMTGIFQRLHRARTALRTAAETIQEFSANPATDPRIAEMWSLTGLMYIAFGENYCSGVPFSTANEDGTLEFGEPQSTTAMFTTAVERADLALSNTGGSSDQANLAAVIKGRALLNLGQFAAAATAVQNVPTGFVYNVEHSTNSFRQNNGIYIMSAVRVQYSIADGKGGNGLPFRTAADPRTPWEIRLDEDGVQENGQDDQTPYFNQLKYTSAASPVPVATGIEARLIEAEAALQAGATGAFETFHTDLRATVGLGSVDVSGMTQTEMEDLHFSERAFWLWGTAHRVGDLRRLVRQYGRAAESVFPTGPYFKAGAAYGTDLNLPVPIEEQNNPNFSGCIDRDA